MTFIDLSHPIEDGMAAYPGLPPVRIFAILDHDASRERYGGQAEFLLGGAELAGNTGTYLDAPFHRFREREDLARLPLETVAGLPGLVVDPAGPGRAVSLEGVDRTVPARTRGPGAHGVGCAMGVGGVLVGRAFPSRDGRRAPRARGGPARRGRLRERRRHGGSCPPGPHPGLLEAGIPIVENLRGLEQLPREGFVFSAPPIALVRGAAFPVRAFAEVE